MWSSTCRHTQMTGVFSFFYSMFFLVPFTLDLAHVDTCHASSHGWLALEESPMNSCKSDSCEICSIVQSGQPVTREHKTRSVPFTGPLGPSRKQALCFARFDNGYRVPEKGKRSFEKDFNTAGAYSSASGRGCAGVLEPSLHNRLIFVLVITRHSSLEKTEGS